MEWTEKIREIQRSRTSPEMMERIRSRSDQQERISRAIKSSNRLQRINVLSTASHTLTLRAFSERSPSVLEESTRNSNRSATFQQHLQAVPRTIEEEEDEQIQFDNIQSDLNLSPIVGHESISNEIESLLEQLAVEPSDSSELHAKFLLFESFSSTVTALREQTMRFYDDNLDQFVGAAKVEIQNNFRKLDSTDAWAILDDSSKWFVYGMTKKANENSVAIQKLLRDMTAKLAILQEELGDCPFCIETIQRGEEKVLGCCHKVCAECWQNWVAIKGHAAFCPLCRHNEFLSEILRTGPLP